MKPVRADQARSTSAVAGCERRSGAFAAEFSISRDKYSWHPVVVSLLDIDTARKADPKGFSLSCVLVVNEKHGITWNVSLSFEPSAQIDEFALIGTEGSKRILLVPVNGFPAIGTEADLFGFLGFWHLLTSSSFAVESA